MQVAATPRGLPDPGAPPKPVQTLTRWTQFLGSIAAGIALPDAMLKHFISRADIEACVRSSAEERTRWDEARLAALKRGWSAFDFEDIFERIAGGMPVQEAICAVRGAAAATGNAYSAFNRIIIADSTLNEMYMAALKSRALVMSEQIIEIADDASNDMAHNDKGGEVPNNAAVNRSKLQVETRARLMGAWHTKMFGEAKQPVQVAVQINHAVRLEEARVRRDTRTVAKASIPQRVMDAAFSEAEVVPEKPEWDDL
jgi:hypothetical protein